MIQLDSTPYFSVIIPSYNRESEIGALLESLDSQSLAKGEFEVIIVDDGSSDGTEEFVAAFRDHAQIKPVFLQQNHRGPGAARNLGMSSANGQILVFIDSDCIAPPEWLEAIRREFDRDPDLDAFGGRDDARDDFRPLVKAISYSMTSFISTGGMRGGKKKRLAKFVPRSFNMGLKKELYKKIGGFGALRHGQDIEFSNRIIRSGAKVTYIQGAVVYHKRRTSIRKFFRQVFNWGVARINLYKIDHAMLEPLHFVPAACFWIAVIFTLLALFNQPLFAIWLVFTLLGIAILALSGIHAALHWKDVRTGLLVPLVMVAQMSGYGLGFTFAFIWRVILRRGEFTGFTKKYYK